VSTTPVPTGPGRTAPRHAKKVPGAFLDGAFVMGLGALGLVGFRAVYGGESYLLVGLIGLALGTMVSEMARRLRQPVLAEAFVTLVVFVVLGGLVAAPKSAVAGFIPSLRTLHDLGYVGIYGWKELLTTAPPVGNSSDLLALPYVVGLVGGVAGQSLARRTRSAALPLAGPALILALGILFGAPHPSSLLLQGSLFGAGSLAWVAVRHQRHLPLVAAHTVNRRRVMSATALLIVAALAAATVGGHLPGSGRTRVVLSRYVVPPFEANQEPSPLAGFRRFVTGGPLSSTPLFTVSGVRPGTLVRIATMDNYDGIVWGFDSAATGGVAPAADAFKKFGPDIPVAEPGARTNVKVRIADLGGIWTPDVGEVAHVSFTGSDASTLADDFRYDPATSTGAEPSGLRPGDTYTLVATLPPTPTPNELASAAPGDVSLSLTGVPTVVEADANQWSSGASSAWGKVMAIANHLLSTGYYSDGTDPTAPAGAPELSPPGHGAGRLATFLTGGGLVGTDIVGDGEQYAAALALMANAIGVPSRVILGGQVRPGGEVRGSDVHAWVEVSLAGLGWVPVSWQLFVPTRPAHEIPPTQVPQAASSTPVQPPVVSALHPPLEDQAAGSSATSLSRFLHSHRAPFQLPAWLAALAWALLAALLVIGSVHGVVVGLKRRRRHHRRWASTTSSQIAGAWAELVDAARDYGHLIPVGGTRREQARTFETPEAASLAALADAAVFGPVDPSAAQVSDFWSSVEHFKDALRAPLSFWRRRMAVMSLRSWRLAEGGVRSRS